MGQPFLGMVRFGRYSSNLFNVSGILPDDCFFRSEYDRIRVFETLTGEKQKTKNQQETPGEIKEYLTLFCCKNVAKDT